MRLKLTLINETSPVVSGIQCSADPNWGEATQDRAVMRYIADAFVQVTDTATDLATGHASAVARVHALLPPGQVTWSLILRVVERAAHPFGARRADVGGFCGVEPKEPPSIRRVC